MKLWFRWAFHYEDNRHKLGMWNLDGTEMGEQWRFQRLDKMIRADIQAKDLKTGTISCIHSCDRDNFLAFKWHKKASFVPFKGMRSHKVMSKTFGIQMVQKNGYEVSVFEDGLIKKGDKYGNYYDND